MKFNLKNLNRATPAKWVKAGLSLTAVSAAIGGYGLTTGIKWVSYVGLGCLVLGTFITNMFGEHTPAKEPNQCND